MTEQLVTCPKCGHAFDVNAQRVALYRQEDYLRAVMAPVLPTMEDCAASLKALYDLMACDSVPTAAETPRERARRISHEDVQCKRRELRRGG